MFFLFLLLVSSLLRSETDQKYYVKTSETVGK